MKILVEFSKKLKKEREKQGLNKSQLCKKAGLSRNYVGKIEKGEKNPTLLIVGKLTNALGVKLL